MIADKAHDGKSAAQAAAAAGKSNWPARIKRTMFVRRRKMIAAMGRYRRRWIVERTIGLLGNFRDSVVRYDRLLRIYPSFTHTACFMIVLTLELIRETDRFPETN